MTHVTELLEALGFKKDAPESSKNAFLRHLLKAAQVPQSAVTIEEPQQLSFDLGDSDLIKQNPSRK